MALRSFRNILLGGAILAATASAPAFAGVTVDFAFGTSGLNNVSYTPDGSIGNANTVVNLGSIAAYNLSSIGADDTTGISGSSVVTLNWNDPIAFVQGTQALAFVVTQTFTTAGGTYSASFNTLFAQSTPGSTSLTWVLGGTLTLPNLATQEVFLSAAFTNVSGTNTATTAVSFTETSSPPLTPTPEPASLAVLGVGSLAIGMVRRRKRSAQ